MCFCMRGKQWYTWPCSLTVERGEHTAVEVAKAHQISTGTAPDKNMHRQGSYIISSVVLVNALQIFSI